MPLRKHRKSTVVRSVSEVQSNIILSASIAPLQSSEIDGGGVTASRKMANVLVDRQYATQCFASQVLLQIVWPDQKKHCINMLHRK